MIRHRVASSSVATILTLSALGLAACRSTPTALPPPTKALYPSCAIVAGEISTGSAAPPRLLISERRGPPNAAQWHYIGDHHIPPTPPPTGTTPSPDFRWPALASAKEVAVSTRGSYQVHVVMRTIGPGSTPGLVDMIQDPDGLWRPPLLVDNTVPSGQPGGPLGIDRGRAGNFRRLSVASVDGRLHVCAIEVNGQIERNIFDPIATNSFEGWTDVEMNIGSETGRFVDVGCAGVFNPATGVEELHVCGVTDDGRLWHAMESPRRRFSPFGDVSAQSGDVGRFERVACAGHAGQLHLVGLTTDHRAWHTTRIPTQWRAFENVYDAAGGADVAPRGANYRDLAIGFCNAEVPADGNRDVSQLNIVLIDGDSERNQIWHTIRATNSVVWTPGSAPGNWRPMQNLAPIMNRTSLSPVPPTTNPALWGGFSVGYRPFPPY